MALAISVRQPWAFAILHLGKDVENRSWRTRVRGRVLIHASKGMTRDEYEDGLDTAHMVSMTRPFALGTMFPPRSDLLFGGIVGEVEIVDCVREFASPWFAGEFGFVLFNPKPLPFLEMKGKLGFFEVRE